MDHQLAGGSDSQPGSSSEPASSSTNERTQHKPHRGILREETQALRTVFGYGRWDVPPDHPISHLEALADTDMMDVLLVGIDIDTYEGYDQIKPYQQFHVGISTLDTRTVRNMVGAFNARPQGETQEGTFKSTEPQYESTGEMVRLWTRYCETERGVEARTSSGIRSYQFILGEGPYVERAERRFLFGPSYHISRSDLKHIFEAIVGNRDSVLILHGANEDLKVMDALGFDLQNRYVIDTIKAAQYPLRLSLRMKLSTLLDTLGIDAAALHAAGNDAHFALRACLMLAVKDAQRMEVDSAPELELGSRAPLLRVLTSIAQAPRPRTRNEEQSDGKQKQGETKVSNPIARASEAPGNKSPAAAPRTSPAVMPRSMITGTGLPPSSASRSRESVTPSPGSLRKEKPVA